MPDLPTNNRLSVKQLVFVPALITLGITLLRLVGELQHWSPMLFRREPGGFGALVGIAWLVPIFGIYFALKFSKAAEQLNRVGKTILYAVLGIIAFIAIGSIPALLKLPFQGQIIFMALGSAVAISIAWRAWPALCKVLLVYGLAARLPVAAVMLAAIRGNWGTHYDVAPPELPPMGVWSKFVWIGLIPQLTLWLAYTVLFGTLFGAIAIALLVRRKPVTEALS